MYLTWGRLYFNTVQTDDYENEKFTKLMIQEAVCTLAKFLIFFQAYFDEIDELITVLPVGILRDVEIDFASFVRRYVTDNKQVQNDSKRVNVSLIKYI